MSDDESAIHIKTPPKGRGKCCAGVHCVKQSKPYYHSPVCGTCRGICHETGCFVFSFTVGGSEYECLSCKHKREQKAKRAKAKADREHKEVCKKIRKGLKLKNPWDFVRLKKMGVVPSPLRK